MGPAAAWTGRADALRLDFEDPIRRLAQGPQDGQGYVVNGRPLVGSSLGRASVGVTMHDETDVVVSINGLRQSRRTQEGVDFGRFANDRVDDRRIMQDFSKPRSVLGRPGDGSPFPEQSSLRCAERTGERDSPPNTAAGRNPCLQIGAEQGGLRVDPCQFNASGGRGALVCRYGRPPRFLRERGACLRDCRSGANQSGLEIRREQLTAAIFRDGHVKRAGEAGALINMCWNYPSIRVLAIRSQAPLFCVACT